MTSPLVSVVLSAFNDENFLRSSIESILNQSYEDFEFIIVNDGSTDGSQAIIESYDDNRIKLVRNSENIFLAASLNKGIRLSKGKYIARMDSDDIAHPDRFSKQVEFLESNSDYGLCG